MAGPGLRYWASAQCGPPPGPGSRTPGFTSGSFDPARNFRRGLSQALARPPNMFRGGHEGGIWSVSWGLKQATRGGAGQSSIEPAADCWAR